MIAPSLFVPSGAALSRSLEQAERAIARVFPLKRAHQAELPYAVRDLSRLLTTDRDQKGGYWSSPRLRGAYLYYFLPWNLLRLARLLPGLPLDLKADDRILDLGSGPLTLPIGLWLARPDLRDLPLDLTCADTAPNPMELGRDILRTLQGVASAQSRDFGAIRDCDGASGDASGDVPGGKATKTDAFWKTGLLRAPLDQALRKGRHLRLITAANVLNELPTPRGESLEERLGAIFLSMDRALEPGGQILLIEPGTRLGGKLVQLVRRQALEIGYEVQAPCLHNAACPFLRDEDDETAHGGGYGSGRGGGWCHFAHDTAGATEKLLDLSEDAKLEKERLSLSFILLRKPDGEGGAATSDQRGSNGSVTAREGKQSKFDRNSAAQSRLSGRVVSGQIRLPVEGSGYYVCTGEGLGLLVGAGRLASGEVVEVRKSGGVDAKSGAFKLKMF